MKRTAVFWTRQVPEVWDELKINGSYHVRKQYIEAKNKEMSDYYLKLYEWYTKEAGKHICIPDGLKYPIWLSVDEDVMLQPVENTIILKVEIPEGQYIICNMNHWGYRVNYWYVPLDAEDEKRHAGELQKNGIASDDEIMLTSKGNFYPILRRKIEASWARVFTIPPAGGQDAAASVWELKREWVKEVRYYGGE